MHPGYSLMQRMASQKSYTEGTGPDAFESKKQKEVWLAKLAAKMEEASRTVTDYSRFHQ